MKVSGQLRKLFGFRKSKKVFATTATQTEDSNYKIKCAKCFDFLLRDIVTDMEVTEKINDNLIIEIYRLIWEKDGVEANRIKQIKNLKKELEVSDRELEKLKKSRSKSIEGSEGLMHLLKCGICGGQYTEETAPRVLYCGHTLCKTCVNHSIAIQRCLKCPRNRNEPIPQNIPKNFALLDVIRSAQMITPPRTPKDA